MENRTFYEQLRERVGCESKDTIWENAKLIYEQCYDKKYLKSFHNQQAFAEYLGITEGRVSQYRYAYEYYLLYQHKIDLRCFSVEQVYTLHRAIGSKLLGFLEWTKNEKKIVWERISLRDTRKLIKEYCNLTKDIGNKSELNDLCNIRLTEHENELIQFYRNGTVEQRELIDSIIKGYL